MDLGQLMAVTQQIPTAVTGVTSSDTVTTGEQGCLFAGMLLQGMTASETTSTLDAAENAPAEGSGQEVELLVAGSTLATLMALRGDSNQPAMPVESEKMAEVRTDQAELAVREAGSQKVIEGAAVSEMAMLADLQVGRMPQSVHEAVSGQQPEKTSVRMTDVPAPELIREQKAVSIQPVVADGVTRITEQATAQAVVPVREEPEKLPPVNSREPIKHTVDSSVPVIPVRRQTEQAVAVTLQKEAPVTEGDEIRPQIRNEKSGNVTQVSLSEELLLSRPVEKLPLGDGASPVVAEYHQQPVERKSQKTVPREVTGQVTTYPSVRQPVELLVTATEHRLLQLEDAAMNADSVVKPAAQTRIMPEQVTPAGGKNVAETVDSAPREVPVDVRQQRTVTVSAVPAPSIPAVEMQQAVDQGQLADAGVPQAVKPQQRGLEVLQSAVQANHRGQVTGPAEDRTESRSNKEMSVGKIAQEQGEHHDPVSNIAAVASDEQYTDSSTDGGTFGRGMNETLAALVQHRPAKSEGTAVFTGTSAAADSATTTPHAAEPAVQQVRDRLVNHSARSGSEQIVLRLTPEHLGELKMNLNMEGQRLKVEIVAENSMVRDALLQNSDLLKDTLSRQNIKMESFDVTTGGNTTSDHNRNQSEWRELAQRRQQNLWMPEGGYRLAQQPAVTAAAAYQPRSQHSMVDLHF